MTHTVSSLDSAPAAPSPTAGGRAEGQGRRRPVVWAGAAAALVVIGLLAYARLPPFAGETAARAGDNARAVLRIERLLGVDVEHAAQESFLGRGVLGSVLAVVYSVVYWPFVVGALAVTVWRDRPSFRLTRNAILISGAVGLVVIAAFPVAPPRLLGGYDDHVGRLALLRSVAHPDGVLNPYAAMPSFHVGWMVIAALGLRGVVDVRWRWTPPAVMAVAVISTGNHYVLDVVAGAVLAGAAWALAAPMQRALQQATRMPAPGRTQPQLRPGRRGTANNW